MPVFIIALYFIRGPFVGVKHYGKGLALERQKDLSGALYEYKRALAADLFNSAYATSVGSVYEKALNCPEAEKYFRRSGFVINLGRAAECYRIKGDLSHAEKILNEKKSDELLVFKVHLLFSQGKFDEAVSAAEKMYQSQKNDQSFDLLLLASAIKDKNLVNPLLLKENRNTVFGTTLKAQLSLKSPDTVDILLAEDLISFNLPDVALTLAKKVTERNLIYRDAFLVLARSYHLVEKDDEALKAAQKAIELDPYYYRSYEFLAELQEILGNKDEAKKARAKADVLNLGN